MKTNKTNAARLLDRAKIPYELVPYEVDENNLAATHVAEQLGENIEQVFKTLVLRGDKHGIFVCVIPGGKEVDLKKAAKIQYQLNDSGVFRYSFRMYPKNPDLPHRQDLAYVRWF